LNDFLVEIGRIVRSRAGRDKDRFFIICEIKNEEYVYISDGDYRKLCQPKLKKLRHLALTSIVLDSIKEKFDGEKKVFDEELRSAIMKAGYNDSGDERGV